MIVVNLVHTLYIQCIWSQSVGQAGQVTKLYWLYHSHDTNNQPAFVKKHILLFHIVAEVIVSVTRYSDTALKYKLSQVTQLIETIQVDVQNVKLSQYSFANDNSTSYLILSSYNQ